MRRNTIRPPLGMSHFPDPNDEDTEQGPGFFENLRHRAQSVIRHPTPGDPQDAMDDSVRSPIHPVALTDIKVHNSKMDSPIAPYGPGSFEDAQERIYGMPAGQLKNERGITVAAQPSPRSKPLPAKPASSPALRPAQEARRQFSFTNFLRPGSRTQDVDPTPRPQLVHRASSNEQKRAFKNGSEEERLGLVKGDSHVALLEHEPSRSPERPAQPMPYSYPASHSQSSSTSSVDDYYRYQHPGPPQHSLSYSDEVDGWQMTNTESPPNETTSAARPPVSTNSRRRPSPPRIHPPQPLITRSSPTTEKEERPMPGTMVGGGPTQGRAVQAVSDHFQKSSTSPPRYTQNQDNGPRRMEDHLPRVSEDARVNNAYEYGLARTESPEAEATREGLRNRAKGSERREG